MTHHRSAQQHKRVFSQNITFNNELTVVYPVEKGFGMHALPCTVVLKFWKTLISRLKRHRFIKHVYVSPSVLMLSLALLTDI